MYRKPPHPPPSLSLFLCYRASTVPSLLGHAVLPSSLKGESMRVFGRAPDRPPLSVLCLRHREGGQDPILVSGHPFLGLKPRA